MEMVRYVGKRVAIAIATLLVILVLLFIMLQFMPGSPFNDDKLTEIQKQVLFEKYGLDKPLIEQFFIYLKNMLKGDFGVSYAIQTNMPVSDMLAVRFPVTIRIGIQSVMIGVFFGLILGVIAALKHNTVADVASSVIAMIGASVPSYVFGLGMAYLFGFKLRWFPLLYSTKQEFMSTVMPTIALSMFPMASIARYARTEMLEILDSDYILLARAKGMSRFRVVTLHALRNTMIPILTVAAPMVVTIITGSTVIESIFAIPGIGSLFVTAIQSNDYNVVITLAFVFSAVYIVTMLAVDILYGILDPRIRVAGGGKNE